MKIVIHFMNRGELTAEADSLREAVESVRNDLACANIEGANLEGANYGGKQLWTYRPIIQLGPCGRYGRSTIVFLFEDKSAPLILCGCFSGTLAEFRAKIKETHGGTFHEREYDVMADHIEAMYHIQQEEVQAK